jgi:hypothetical protein
MDTSQSHALARYVSFHKLVPRAEDGVALFALDTSSCFSET